MSWMSKRQSTVALSTTKSDYMIGKNASKEVICLQGLGNDIGLILG